MFEENSLACQDAESLRFFFMSVNYDVYVTRLSSEILAGILFTS